MAATMIAAFVAPTFAAGEYYVVQDVRTKKCTVIDRKPHRLIEAVRECRRDRLQDTLGSGERHEVGNGLRVGLKGAVVLCPAVAWFETWGYPG
jgi:hypothetical protein